VTQVSRFDPWKDPLGVIDAYRIVKEHIPEVQLALVGSMASDDPEGWSYLDKTIRHAGEDFDVHILHNFHGVGAVEVAAFQTVSDVVMQKSTREGFGLVVTEPLWKGKPVVGGNAGGIPLQVIDGETGFLVESVEQCAEKTLYLLEHPQEAERMGAAGREHVRKNFLSTRHLTDYLKLFGALAA
jgi:trehalose synthase